MAQKLFDKNELMMIDDMLTERIDDVINSMYEDLSGNTENYSDSDIDVLDEL